MDSKIEQNDRVKIVGKDTIHNSKTGIVDKVYYWPNGDPCHCLVNLGKIIVEFSVKEVEIVA